jgi:hypothetical protein
MEAATADTIKAIRAEFLELIKGLTEHVKLNSRMDIRDKIAALALIDRVLAREKPDESERAGSAIRKYAPAFKAPDGTGWREAAPRDGGENVDPTTGWRDRGADGGEPAGGDDDDRPDPG